MPVRSIAVPDDPPELPPGRFAWRTADAPTARGLSPEEALDEQLVQLRTIRDDDTQPSEIRASAAAMIEARGGESRLRAVEDDEDDER